MKKLLVSVLAFCLVLLPFAGAANFYLDNFDGTIATALSAHTGDTNATYTKRTTSSAAESTLSGAGALVGATGTSQNFVYYAVTGSTPSNANYTVKATILVTGTAIGGVTVGARTSTNADTSGYFFSWLQSAGRWILYDVAGNATLGQSSVTTPSAGTHTMAIEMSGTTINCYVDDVLTIGPIVNSSTSSTGKPMIGHTIANSGAASSITFLQAQAYPSVLALSNGVASLTGLSLTGASLSLTVAAGGDGSFTYQWYRDTSSGFTPGGGNAVVGETSLTINDTGLSTGTTYYYKNVVTDGNLATATSNEVVATPTGGSTFVF